MQLSKFEQQNYSNLSKGFEGELKFDVLTSNLVNDCLVLNDLLLKTNSQTFQIDTLLLTNNLIYLLEIKNYVGDFYYKSDRLFMKDQLEISNPLIQLTRSESLLSQLLNKLNYTIPIQSFVIFINPSFTLYQAPPDKPFIFPTQLQRFISTLSSQPSKLKNQHKKLAEKLVSLHIEESNIKQIPSFDFQLLRKGILCSNCYSFITKINGMKCICTSCGNEELVETAVVRNIKEFRLLFPHKKITTNQMYEWCTVIPQKRRIQKILQRNFKQFGVRQWTYYE
ncbi:nuclease-related domain-containing protein [Lysinibacillus sp. SGAir0095]|uniref:nuclease-related domain-containing protein n=1 Tax=Lysinibacillus sp. SGAir0095 TaxID=2070463 RepID=UPI0010CD10BA|nr:nuclease-related domain-containing protein [Lysinibacillus sp. SGAir0095]QCR31855.1 nuclease [Lysinibacillus sp. SGAir0095]